jgi:Protein of unknown function (DUF3082)
MTNSPVSTNSNGDKPLTPLRSLTGALIAGIMASLLYRLTMSVVHSFMAHPTITHNTIVRNISAAVRTLVVGGMTMGTGIFSLVAVGLVALAIKIAFQPASPPKSETSSM